MDNDDDNSLQDEGGRGGDGRICTGDVEGLFCIWHLHISDVVIVAAVVIGVGGGLATAALVVVVVGQWLKQL